MKKAFLIIDGGNFYRKLKLLKIKSLLEFDYKEFAIWLTKNDKLVDYVYYVGQIREEPGNVKSKKFKRDFVKNQKDNLQKDPVRKRTG